MSLIIAANAKSFDQSDLAPLSNFAAAFTGYEVFPPQSGYPQVTISPEDFKAANDPFVEVIETTLSVNAYAELTGDVVLPPKLGSPQATTEPSDFKAANAESVEKICLTSALRNACELTGNSESPP